MVEYDLAPVDSSSEDDVDETFHATIEEPLLAMDASTMVDNAFVEWLNGFNLHGDIPLPPSAPLPRPPVPEESTFQTESDFPLPPSARLPRPPVPEESTFQTESDFPLPPSAPLPRPPVPEEPTFRVPPIALRTISISQVKSFIPSSVCNSYF
ncbi:hypothetical protein Ciccas_013827 [Cichlidogyrus casuarinus]|uniref:Uncharacterized protein n=1 Tax=Cichlidogyrus casuarinus TaxID=1844966 RepID=A0ABD2PL17_9PLAT